MTPQQIGKVWVTLSLLLVYYALNSWIVTQGGNEIFGTKLVASGRAPAALTAIPICSVLMVLCALVGRLYQSRSAKPGWHGGLPIVGFDDIDTASREGMAYQGTMFVLLILLPLASLVHFWLAILGATVATNHDPPMPIASIWDWSQFAWSDPARICSTYQGPPAPACLHNATFIPGLEPTAFAVLTALASMAVALQILGLLRRR